MAYPGQTFYNPVTHERITFLRTSDQTDGASIRFECRVTPGGAKLPPHVHRTQEERFVIKHGTLGAMLGGKKYRLEPGEGIILPKGVKHQWWVEGDQEVSFDVEVVPARNLEGVIEAIATMAEQGKLNKKAAPKNPFLLVNLGRYSETYLPGIPIFMQRMGMAVGSRVGKLLGYDPEFKSYRPSLQEAAETAPLAEAA